MRFVVVVLAFLLLNDTMCSVQSKRMAARQSNIAATGVHIAKGKDSTKTPQQPLEPQKTPSDTPLTPESDETASKKDVNMSSVEDVQAAGLYTQDMCDDQLGDAKFAVQSLVQSLLGANEVWATAGKGSLLSAECQHQLYRLFDGYEIVTEEHSTASHSQRTSQPKSAITKWFTSTIESLRAVFSKPKRVPLAEVHFDRNLIQPPNRRVPPRAELDTKAWFDVAGRVAEKILEYISRSNVQRFVGANLKASTLTFWAPNMKSKTWQMVVMTISDILTFAGLIFVYGALYFKKISNNPTVADEWVVQLSFSCVVVLAVALTVVYVVAKFREVHSRQMFIPGYPAIRSDVFTSIFISFLWCVVLIISGMFFRGFIDINAFVSSLVKILLVVSVALSIVRAIIWTAVKSEEQWRERLQFFLLSNLRKKPNQFGDTAQTKDWIVADVWEKFLPEECHSSGPNTETCTDIVQLPFHPECHVTTQLQDTTDPKVGSWAEELTSIKSVMKKLATTLNVVSPEEKAINEIRKHLLQLIEISSIAYLCSNAHQSARFEAASAQLQSSLTYLGLLVGALGASNVV